MEPFLPKAERSSTPKRSGSLATFARTGGIVRGALEHAEAVLLVDHREPEIGVCHVIGEQSVGTQDDVESARGERGEDFLSRRVVYGAREEGQPDAEGFKERGGGRGVLAREKLRRRENDGLSARFHYMEAGYEGDEGLARSHVPLEQARHGVGALEIPRDLVACPALVGGQFEGKPLDEPAGEQAPQGRARHFDPSPLERPARHGELEVVAGRFREVHVPEGPGFRQESPAGDDVPWQFVFHARAEAVQGHPDEAAHGLLGEPAGERVDREKTPFDKVGGFGVLEVEDTGLQASVPVLEGPRHDHPGSDRERRGEEGPIEAHEIGLSCAVGDRELQGAHPAVSEMIVGGDGREGVDPGVFRRLSEGYEDGAVVVFAGESAQKLSDIDDALSGEPGSGRSYAAPERRDRLREFAQEHGEQYTRGPAARESGLRVRKGCRPGRIRWSPRLRPPGWEVRPARSFP